MCRRWRHRSLDLPVLRGGRGRHQWLLWYEAAGVHHVELSTVLTLLLPALTLYIGRQLRLVKDPDPSLPLPALAYALDGRPGVFQEGPR